MSALSWLERLASRVFVGHSLAPQRLAEMRFTVVDVDVTGTSTRRDRVTGIAALPVEAGALRISDLRYCAVPGVPAGPGVSVGSEWRDAYASVVRLVRGHPIVTYNPRFVRQMLRNCSRRRGIPAIDGEWMDLDAMARSIGSADDELTTMTYWLANMRSGGRRLHDAAYDVFAMAQLLQAVIAYGEDAGIVTSESLGRLQEARPWLHGG
jgi:DNA polymerase III epsilon subunit-like protein